MEKFSGDTNDESWKTVEMMGYPCHATGTNSGRFLVKEFIQPLRTRYNIGHEFWEGGKDATACPLSTHYEEANHVLTPCTSGMFQPHAAALAHPTMLFLANFFANVDKVHVLSCFATIVGLFTKHFLFLHDKY